MISFNPLLHEAFALHAFSKLDMRGMANYAYNLATLETFLVAI